MYYTKKFVRKELGSKATMLNSNLLKNLLFVLDSGNSRFKNKLRLKKIIVNAGGTISYIINKKVCYVVISNGEDDSLDNYRLRQAKKLDIPIVKENYIFDSIEQNCLMDVEKYRVTPSKRDIEFRQGKISVGGWKKNSQKKIFFHSTSIKKSFKPLLRIESGSKSCPSYPSDYSIVKFFVLKRKDTEKEDGINQLCTVLELHIASLKPSMECYHRVLEQSIFISDDGVNQNASSYEYFSASFEEALWFMQHLLDQLILKQKMQTINYLPHNKIGSVKLRRMLDEMGAAAGNLHPQVARIMNGIAKLAFDELLHSISKDSILTLTPEQIIKASVALMKAKSALKDNKPTLQFSKDFTSALQLKKTARLANIKDLSKYHDFLQLIKDTLLLSENKREFSSVVTADITGDHVLSFYKMLKCSVVVLEEEDADYLVVKNLLANAADSIPPGFVVRNIFSLHRDIEESRFSRSITPTKLLLHSSDPKNFVGILSRGLLPPFVVVGEHGGVRSDAGMLGGAIYFTDNISKAASYSKPNPHSGGRLMLVNEVALGKCLDLNTFSPDLSRPPDGFNSVRGVGRSAEVDSNFEVDEYGIYNVEQQRLRYLIEFTIEGDCFIEVEPNPTSLLIPTPNPIPVSTPHVEEVDLMDVENVPNPLDKEKFGLLPSQSNSDFCAVLKEVHIRSKLMDMSAEVVVMQAYSNESRNPVEAKYVFPLDDAAAVCGFEAFINNKHVIGKVKEKEAARREYREAVDAGHGAYLMDQEKADVFTVNVGNLPPYSTVLIKIMYVCELPVIAADDGSSDRIVLQLPGSVAPEITRRSLFGPVTQTKVDTVTAEGSTLRRCSFMASVEMPYDIREISSSTHRMHVKRTSSKACVKMAKGQVLGPSGLQLSVTMAEIHVPRMWMEEHPEKSGEYASMLAFYPEFDADPVTDYKAVIMIDVSQSMGSIPAEKLDVYAKKLALMILKSLPPSCVVNVVRFGSIYEELFVREQSISNDAVQKKASQFIQSCSALHGSSECWRPLRSLDLLQRSSGCEAITNVFLISDGHLSEEGQLLHLSRSLGGSRDQGSLAVTRIFTFSVGSSANKHLLRAMSHASGGAHEHFSADAKSKWEQKVSNQLSKAQQPVLRDIRVTWSIDDDMPRDDASLPPQAPETIKTFFNNSRLVVYGFVPFCTMANLHARIGESEVNAVASTSELNIKRGKMLHRLAARAFIKDYDGGMCDVDPLKRDELKRARKPHIIALSCEHDVMSQYTSFVAVEERKQGEDTVSKDAPTIEDLVGRVQVDVIPEISWSEEVLEEDLVFARRLRSAGVASMTSVGEAERLFVEIDEIISSATDVEKFEMTLKMVAAKLEFGVGCAAGEEMIIKTLRTLSRLLINNIHALKSDPQRVSICLSNFSQIESRIPPGTSVSERWRSLHEEIRSVLQPSAPRAMRMMYSHSIQATMFREVTKTGDVGKNVQFYRAQGRSKKMSSSLDDHPMLLKERSHVRRSSCSAKTTRDNMSSLVSSYLQSKVAASSKDVRISRRSKDVSSSPRYVPTSPSYAAPVDEYSNKSDAEEPKKSLPKLRSMKKFKNSMKMNEMFMKMNVALQKHASAKEETVKQVHVETDCSSGFAATNKIPSSTGHPPTSPSKPAIYEDSSEAMDTAWDDGVVEIDGLVEMRAATVTTPESNLTAAPLVIRCVPANSNISASPEAGRVDRFPVHNTSAVFQRQSISLSSAPPPVRSHQSFSSQSSRSQCQDPYKKSLFSKSRRSFGLFGDTALRPECADASTRSESPSADDAIISGFGSSKNVSTPPPSALSTWLKSDSEKSSSVSSHQANFAVNSEPPKPSAPSCVDPVLPQPLFGLSGKASTSYGGFSFGSTFSSAFGGATHSLSSASSSLSSPFGAPTPPPLSSRVASPPPPPPVSRNGEPFKISNSLFSTGNALAPPPPPTRGYGLSAPVSLPLQSSAGPPPPPPSDARPPPPPPPSAAGHPPPPPSDAGHPPPPSLSAGGPPPPRSRSTREEEFQIEHLLTLDDFSDYEESCYEECCYEDLMETYDDSLYSCDGVNVTDARKDPPGTDADRNNESATSTGKGFKNFRDILLKLYQKCDPNPIDDSEARLLFWNIIQCGGLKKIPNFEMKDLPPEFKKATFSILDEILAESGARSLGVNLFNVCGAMLIVAMVIGMIQEFHLIHSVFLPKTLSALQAWLTEMDGTHPSFYFRLQLGNSWPDAAARAANLFLNRWRELELDELLMGKVWMHKFDSYFEHISPQRS